MSDFIPNSFQVPNVLVDDLMCSLAPLEFCCLILIIRKTRGWHKDIDAIALSQFKKHTGVTRDKTLYEALQGLRQKGFIRIRKKRGMINQYELTGLFGTSGEFATSGKFASGKNASRVVANLPPYKKQTKYSGAAEESDAQLADLGRNVGLVKSHTETHAEFRTRVITEMSKRRFDAMQSK